jgi:hypothetical protein
LICWPACANTVSFEFNPADANGAKDAGETTLKIECVPLRDSGVIDFVQLPKRAAPERPQTN